jgi:hypothetical protein
MTTKPSGYTYRSSSHANPTRTDAHDQAHLDDALLGTWLVDSPRSQSSGDFLLVQGFLPGLLAA